MQISIGTIFVSEHCYNLVNEIRIKGHFKNMSQAVNTLIGHYQAILEQKEAMMKRIQELTRIAADQKSLIDAYRGQIVGDKK